MTGSKLAETVTENELPRRRMFHRTKKGPDRPFVHSDGCKILAADPSVQIEWSEIERGHWQAVCVCGKDYHEPAGDRVRLDPLDPKTAHHAGQCEFVSVSDPSVLRLVLRVVDKDDYWWTSCSACDMGWQVPHFSEVTHE